MLSIGSTNYNKQKISYRPAKITHCNK